MEEPQFSSSPPYVLSYHKIQLTPWARKCLATTRCFPHASTSSPAPANSPTEAMAEGHRLYSDCRAACHQWHHCPSRALPAQNWTWSLSSYGTRRQHSCEKQLHGLPCWAGWASSKTETQTSAWQTLALCAVCGHRNLQKLEKPNEGKGNIHSFPHIYSFARLLPHLVMHSFNYSLLNTVFGEAGILRFHYLVKETSWIEMKTIIRQYGKCYNNKILWQQRRGRHSIFLLYKYWMEKIV